MANSRDLYSAEDALERSPWCILVPTTEPDDPNIIGPFIGLTGRHYGNA